MRHTAHHSLETFLNLDPVVYNEDSIYHFSLFCSDQAVESLDMFFPEDWDVVGPSVSTNATFTMDPFSNSDHLQRVFVRSEEDITGYYLELDVKVRPGAAERSVIRFGAFPRVRGFDSSPGTGMNMHVTVQRTPF